MDPEEDPCYPEFPVILYISEIITARPTVLTPIVWTQWGFKNEKTNKRT